MSALLTFCLLSPRVLVVGGDAELRSAVQVALAPWSVEVLISDAPPPPSTMPDAARRAELLGSEQNALAVVWASEGTLWIWDRAGEQLIARPLRAALPLEPAAAASAALSVKTVLRSTLVAPEPERLVPRADPLAAVEPGVWHLEAAGGPRIWPQAGWETRLHAGLRWHFVELGVSAGSGLEVDDPAFLGRLRDVQAGLAAHLDWGGERVRVDLALGSSLHYTTLEGVVRPGDLSRTVNRADASVDVGTALDARVSSHVGVGIFAAGDVFVRRQRYLAGEMTVLDLSPVAIDLGMRVLVDLQ